MAIVEPGKGRAIIEQTGGGLRIILPVRKQIRLRGALEYVLTSALGLYVLTSFLPYLHARDLTFTTIFFWICLAVFFIAAAYEIGMRLWDLAGREIIDLDAKTLRYEKQKPFLGHGRDYRVADITHLRVATDAPGDPGSIAFEIGSETRKFGIGLTAAEARHVVGAICRYATSLCARGAGAPEQPQSSGVDTGMGRMVIEPVGGELRVTIPARRHAFTTVIGLVIVPLLFVDLALEIDRLIVEHPSTDVAYRILWIVLGFLGGLGLLGVLLWNLAGKEIIAVDATRLSRRKEIPFVGRRREYGLAHIENLGPAPPRIAARPSWLDMVFLNFDDHGAIVFDYGCDNHRLGVDLDQAEAALLITQLCAHTTSLCSSAATAQGAS